MQQTQKVNVHVKARHSEGTQLTVVTSGLCTSDDNLMGKGDNSSHDLTYISFIIQKLYIFVNIQPGFHLYYKIA